MQVKDIRTVDDLLLLPKYLESVKSRLLSNSSMSECGCLNWNKSVNNKNRPQMKIGRLKQLTSRVSYVVFNLVPVHDWHVLHSCDNELCVNPIHLRLGTHKENMVDRLERGKSQKGEMHNISKLIVEDVLAIRQLHGSGYSQSDLAALYQISPSQIANIVHRRHWTHI